MRRLIALVALALGSLLLAPGAGQAEPRVHVIEIADMAFGPAPAGIRAGDTVVWRNRDIVPHTATADDGAFDVNLPPGEEGKTLIGKAGSIAYFCRFHPGMKAILTVGP